MCGISGFVGLSHQGLNRRSAEKMISAISHRGPDHTATVEINQNLYFSHARLSIVDQSDNGNQPMNSQDDWITFNGEIFNYEALRKKYLNDVMFKSETDSEVLLELLRRKGLNILQELDGFFCFAYYSYPNIYLVRDFFGKKPVYYGHDKSGFVFASEIKAFKEIKFPFEPNHKMASEIFRYRFSTSLSPFENIKLLDPGTYLKLDINTGSFAVLRYYDLCEKIDVDRMEYYSKQKESIVLAEIENALLDAVNKRCTSTVNMATICSGGLDSSLISAIAAYQGVKSQLHVDVIGNSEKPYAELVAKELGCQAHSVKFDQLKFDAMRQETIIHYEYPLVHPNSVGILALSDLAKDLGMKIILGGEGADELFGGYSHHARFLRIQRLKKIINKFGLKRTFEKLSILSQNMTVTREYQNRVRDLSDLSLMEDYERILKKYNNCPDAEYLAFLFCDLNTYLSPLLLRGDKLFMARGIELRLPFMDKALVELAVNLPIQYRSGKSSLKKIAKKYIPKKIINRRKNGFALALPSLQESSNNNNILTDEQVFISNSMNELYRYFD